MTHSLSDSDRAALGRAAEIAALRGADAVRRWAGSQSFDVATTLTAYAEAFTVAQALLGDLANIIERLADSGSGHYSDHAAASEDADTGDDPETYHCATCKATIGVFIEREDEGWLHYRGAGTAADPVAIYTADHLAVPTGFLA